MKQPVLILLFSIILVQGTYSQHVGVGTTTPQGILHLKGTNWTKTIFENNTGEARGYIGADNNGTITLASNAYWDGSNWQYPNTGSSMYLILHRLTNQFEFRVRPDGGVQSTPMVIEVGGNVGVGTTNPQQNLSVGGSIVVDQNNTNTGTTAGMLSFGSFSGEGIGSKRNAGPGQYGLDFYTISTIRMTITNSGNIGIATVTPAEKLEINGALKIGTTSAANAGAIRFNPANNDFEGYDGSQWRSFTAMGGGSTPPAPDTSTNIASGGRLGFSVDIDNDFAVAGAPFETIGSNANQGSVSIYKKHPVTGKWAFYQKITLTGGAAGDNFGYAVGIDDNLVAVGVPNRDITGTDAGAVYFYKLNGNTGVWELANMSGAGSGYISPGVAGDNFGFSMDFEGGNLLIGAPKDDVSINADQGTVWSYGYIVNTSGNFPVEEIGPYGSYTSTDGQPGDNFGYAVKIIKVRPGSSSAGELPYSQIFAAGAPFNNSGGVSDRGAVYIFQEQTTGAGGIAQTGKIFPSTGTANNQFGLSIDFSSFGTYNIVSSPFTHQLAIGSKKENGAQTNQGAIYVYNGEGVLTASPITWTLSASFTNADGAAGNLFGQSVRYINNSALLIGCPGNNGAGALYRYIRLGNTTWQFDKKITDPSPSANQQLGYSLAISGSGYVTGVPDYSYGSKTNAGKLFFGSTSY